MPTYAYQCQACQVRFERTLAMSAHSQPQSCECGAGPAQRVVGSPEFVLKGDMWLGKNMKINQQMRSRRKRLGVKENEQLRDAPPMTLAPNVDGQRVGSWAEAKKLAASKGKNTTSYNQYVKKEREA